MNQCQYITTRLCFLLIIGVLLTESVYPQLKAFPEAQGWAASTQGGRYGEIVRVSTLNLEGPGSISEAINSSGPRIVVFEVGGIINLKGRFLSINNPFITIAGQTSPSPGITFINGGLQVSTHDVVIQHIRVRPGSQNLKKIEADGISTIKDAHKVIIDHCSFSWAVDENCSVSGERFVGQTPSSWRKNTSHCITVSNNIIAEGLSNSIHRKGEHSKGSLIHDNVTEVAIIGNLYASNNERNPLFKGGTRGVIVNNFIYNPGNSAIHFTLVEREWENREVQIGYASVVGNVLQLGPSSKDLSLVTVGQGPFRIYLNDNIAKTRFGDAGRVYTNSYDMISKKRQIWISNIKVIRASDVKQHVIKNAGARPWDRDLTDKRIINEMIELTGHIIDSEHQVSERYRESSISRKKFSESDWNLLDMTSKKPYNR